MIPRCEIDLRRGVAYTRIIDYIIDQSWPKLQIPTHVVYYASMLLVFVSWNSRGNWHTQQTNRPSVTVLRVRWDTSSVWLETWGRTLVPYPLQRRIEEKQTVASHSIKYKTRKRNETVSPRTLQRFNTVVCKTYLRLKRKQHSITQTDSKATFHTIEDREHWRAQQEADWRST